MAQFNGKLQMDPTDFCHNKKAMQMQDKEQVTTRQLVDEAQRSIKKVSEIYSISEGIG